MRLANHIRRDLIFQYPGPVEKVSLLGELVGAISSRLPEIDGETLLKRLLEREELQSTGMDGVGVPEAVVEGLDETLVVLAQIPDGLEFDSVDGLPVRLLFVLLIPPSAGGRYLKLVGRICRLMRKEGFVRDIAAAEDADGIYERVVLADGGSATANADPAHRPPRVAESRAPRRLDSLMTALRQPRDSAVRARAAAALGKLGDPRAVQPLIVAARDPDRHVRGLACETLAELGTEEAFAFLMAEAKTGSHDGVLGLCRLGPVRGANAVIEVIDHCKKSRPEDVYWQLGALGKLGGERAFQRLKQEVEEGEPEAVWPLARTGDPRAMDVLIRRLCNHDPAAIRDTDAFGVAHAAGALALLGDAQAVEPLIAVLRDTSKPPLSAEDFYAAEDRRKRILVRVIRALADLGDARAIPELQKLRKHQPDEIVREAVRALEKSGSRASH
jgi:PTS system nitrogen regulatory IIA component